MIRGKTVMLTTIEPADLDLVRQWRNDPSVYETMASREIIGAAQQADWYDRVVSSRDNVCLLVRIVSDNDAVGVVHLKCIDARNRNAEAGIYIAEDKYRGNLYGPEALFLLLDYGFGYLNLHKAYAHVLVENEVALRMNEAFGFRVEGTLRDEVFYGGRYHDYYRIGVLRNEFYRSDLAKRFS